MLANIERAIKAWESVTSLKFELTDKDEEKVDIQFSFEPLSKTDGMYGQMV